MYFLYGKTASFKLLDNYGSFWVSMFWIFTAASLEMQKITVFLGLLCVLVIVCKIVPTSMDRNTNVVDSHNIKGYVMNERQRRSWTSLQFAWKKILKGTVVFIKRRSLQVYTKRANVDQAFDDFYALHPTDVTLDPAEPNLLVGKVGSYTVSLFTGPTDPGKSRAILTLTKRAEYQLTSKFIYYEDF